MRDYGSAVDAVVVGGGIAGLTAAALIAQKGRRVTLLERSHHLGGRAMTHVEQGFHLNYGPHAWYVGGGGTDVLRSLGIVSQGARHDRPVHSPSPRTACTRCRSDSCHF
jgi:phytoene dehydrogenase-like protein